jgi:hypothetical protein
MKAITRSHRGRGRSELALQRRLPPSRHPDGCLKVVFHPA